MRLVLDQGIPRDANLGCGRLRVARRVRTRRQRVAALAITVWVHDIKVEFTVSLA